MYINGNSWKPEHNVNLIECDRERQKFHGFHLQVGYVYGRDCKGAFVSPMIHDDSKRAGLNARILLWRLHPERGWAQVWEQSATVATIMQFTGKRKPTKPASRYHSVNPLAGVPRKHGHVVIFK